MDHRTELLGPGSRTAAQLGPAGLTGQELNQQQEVPSKGAKEVSGRMAGLLFSKQSTKGAPRGVCEHTGALEWFPVVVGCVEKSVPKR